MNIKQTTTRISYTLRNGVLVTGPLFTQNSAALLEGKVFKEERRYQIVQVRESGDVVLEEGIEESVSACKILIREKLLERGVVFTKEMRNSKHRIVDKSNGENE